MLFYPSIPTLLFTDVKISDYEWWENIYWFQGIGCLWVDVHPPPPPLWDEYYGMKRKIFQSRIFIVQVVFSVGPNIWIFLWYCVYTNNVKANILKYVGVVPTLPDMILSQANNVFLNFLALYPVISCLVILAPLYTILQVCNVTVLLVPSNPVLKYPIYPDTPLYDYVFFLVGGHGKTMKGV